MQRGREQLHALPTAQKSPLLTQTAPETGHPAPVRSGSERVPAKVPQAPMNSSAKVPMSRKGGETWGTPGFDIWSSGNPREIPSRSAQGRLFAPPRFARLRAAARSSTKRTAALGMTACRVLPTHAPARLIRLEVARASGLHTFSGADGNWEVWRNARVFDGGGYGRGGGEGGDGASRRASGAG